MEGLVSSNFERMGEALELFKREAGSASQKLKAEMAKLEEEKAEFAAYKKEEQAKLDADRKRFHEECRLLYKQYGVGTSDDNSVAAAAAQVSTFPAPVKLNVGGKTFQTLGSLVVPFAPFLFFGAGFLLEPKFNIKHQRATLFVFPRLLVAFANT